MRQTSELLMLRKLDERSTSRGAHTVQSALLATARCKALIDNRFAYAKVFESQIVHQSRTFFSLEIFLLRNSRLSLFVCMCERVSVGCDAS